MERPLLQTKLQLPAVPDGSLYSQRLRDLGLADRRLSLLAAPAGFGKTTAVLLALRNMRRHMRWYRLESEDAWLPTFYEYLLAMLFTEPADSFRMLHSLQALHESYPLLNAEICQEMTFLYSERSTPLYLVFDDYHLVCDQNAIRQTMWYLIKHMPPCVRFIITARRDPGLLTGSWLLNAGYRQFTSEHLLFTEPEIRTLAKSVYNLDLTGPQLNRLFRISEGWIAGIHIICRSGDFSDDFSAHPGGDARSPDDLFAAYLRDYLAAIPDERRQRLMRLAVLEDFSIEELNGLLRLTDAAGFLRWLESSHLYIQKIQGQPVRYRFHALFRQALRQIFQMAAGQAEYRRFCEQIAAYYRLCAPFKAIPYNLMAGREDLALALAAEQARDCFGRGQPEQFFPLLNLFTPDQAARDPCLRFMSAMQLINLNRAAAQSHLMLALDGFKANRDYAFLMHSFGMLLVIAFQTNDFGPLKQAARKIPAAAILLSGGTPRIDLIISRFIALTGEDRLTAAGKYTRFLDRKTILEDMWQFSYLMIRGIYYYRTGRLSAAKLNLERVLSHPVMRSNDQWRIIGLVSCCNISFLTGDPDLIQFFINEFLMLGERYHADFALGYAHYIAAFQKYMQGDPERDLNSLSDSAEHFAAYGSELLLREIEALILIMNPAEPDEAAVHTAETCRDFFCRESPGHGMAELGIAALGLVHKRRGEFQKAEPLLKESLSISIRKGARQDAYGLYLQLADLYNQIGQHKKSRYYMRQWASAGERHHYRYARELDLDTLARVLPEAAADAVCSAHARQAEAFYRQIAGQPGDGAGSHPILCCFGHFELQYGGVVLSDRDFKTKKVSGLCQYILTQEQPQSREHLASVFWPDADRKSAYTSLRVALYELRKTLARANLSFESDRALLEETKAGFSLRNGLEIQSDVQDFERLYRQFKESPQPASAEILHQLCGLYRGPYLGAVELDSSVMIRREHYAAMYAEALHALGRLAIQNSDTAAEAELLRGLELDPLDDALCGLLIALYDKTGQPHRAQALKKQFSRRFEAEMGVPADLTPDF